MITAIVIFSITVFIILIFTVSAMARAITRLRADIDGLKYKEAEALRLIDQQDAVLHQVTRLLDDPVTGAAQQFSEIVLLLALIPGQQDKNACQSILQTTQLFEAFLLKLVEILPYSIVPSGKSSVMRLLETARRRALHEMRSREQAQ